MIKLLPLLFISTCVFGHPHPSEKYKFICTKIQEYSGYDGRQENVWRCENSEVICYATGYRYHALYHMNICIKKERPAAGSKATEAKGA